MYFIKSLTSPPRLSTEDWVELCRLSPICRRPPTTSPQNRASSNKVQGGRKHPTAAEWDAIFRGSSPSQPTWMPTPSQDRANPNEVPGAEKLLGLENELSYTKEMINERLQKNLEDLTKRKENPHISPPLAIFMQGLIDDEKKAAATLLKHLTSKGESQGNKSPT